MIFKVPTSHRQVSLDLRVHTDEPRELVFIGFDPVHNNTEYFHRERNRKAGDDRLVFHLPQSPRRLHVLVFDRAQPRKSNPGTFSIPSFTVNPLETKRSEIDPRDRANIRFIERFARTAGYAPPGIRRNLSSSLVIDYLPAIRMNNGKIFPTPARIHKMKNYIQVSKKHFDKLTIPQRIAIMLHEYSHNFKNYVQDNEEEADHQAFKIYTKLGYPDNEGVHAFERIFGNNDNDRIQSIAYQVKQEGQTAQRPYYNNDILG